MENNHLNYSMTVTAQSVFVPEQSSEIGNRYVFAYHIKIENTGDVPAMLVGRHWHIEDALGRVQEVSGVGVVGEQPYLAPGEVFEYSSGTSIATPVGVMRGSYQMVADDGTSFDAPVPLFHLIMPRVLH